MSEALVMRQITHWSGAVRALDRVDFTAKYGEVHGLLGENGAGKSTLLNVASAMVVPSSGEVTVGGRSLRRGDVAGARRAGIGVVYQHFMLVDAMTVLDNVVLGSEPRRGFLGLSVDRASARASLCALASRHGLAVDPDAEVGALSVGERQRVEILKVLAQGAKVILLDEPTAVLAGAEIAQLLRTVRGLADAGAAVVLVTHKLDEIMPVADTLTVLRRGRVVATGPRADFTEASLVEAMVGGETHAPAHGQAPPGDDVVLSLDALEAEGLGPVSLQLRAGESVGVVGVEGNGQRALVEAIAGVRRVSRGAVTLGRDDITHASVVARRRRGLGWVPEDRSRGGLVLDLTVAENIALGDAAKLNTAGRLDLGALEAEAREVIDAMAIRPADPTMRVGALSGGNQQKVLVGRELRWAPKVLVISQPSRGVDLGARAMLHQRLEEARQRGMALLVVSSDLDELRALTRRVVVMRRGKLVGELSTVEASDARLGPLMLGGAEDR